MNESTEPHWLEEQDLVAVQALWHYAAEPPSLFDLASRLAYGLAKNHGFVDGNKLTAFIATFTFLSMNGVVIQASQQDVVETMEALASSIDEPGLVQARFAHWLSTVIRATAQEFP